MKKAFSLALALLLVLLALTACGIIKPAGDGGAQPAAVGSDEPAITEAEELKAYKTIGDVLALESAEHQQSATFWNTYTYVFSMDGTIYRVVAPMSSQTFDAILALDFSEDDYEDKLNELISPLEIERHENLSTAIPSQKLLDELIGKTGEELLNDGWDVVGYFLDEMKFYMNHGLFEYAVTFDGKLTYSEDFDEYEEIKPLKVKSVAYESLGNATADLEEEFAD